MIYLAWMSHHTDLTSLEVCNFAVTLSLFAGRCTLFNTRLWASCLSSSASGEARLGFVEMERSSNSLLIRDYPGHESLWCYRRFLCQAFLLMAPPAALLSTATVSPQEEGTSPQENKSSDTARKGTRESEEVEFASEERLPSRKSLSTKTEENHFTAGNSGIGYDWAGWHRAVTEWYEGCLRVDAEEQDSTEDENSDDEIVLGEGAQGDGPDYETAEGMLPGAPSGGGMLARFLGEEVRFALKCATDKVGCGVIVCLGAIVAVLKILF